MKRSLQEIQLNKTIRKIDASERRQYRFFKFKSNELRLRFLFMNAPFSDSEINSIKNDSELEYIQKKTFIRILSLIAFIGLSVHLAYKLLGSDHTPFKALPYFIGYIFILFFMFVAFKEKQRLLINPKGIYLFQGLKLKKSIRWEKVMYAYFATYKDHADPKLLCIKNLKNQILYLPIFSLKTIEIRRLGATIYYFMSQKAIVKPSLNKKTLFFPY